MDNTSTGRPSGRPKTKAYGTLLARVPHDLVDRVRVYASRHHVTVASLIREGIEWRIAEKKEGAHPSEIPPHEGAYPPEIPPREDARPPEIPPHEDTRPPEIPSREDARPPGIPGTTPA